MDNQLQPINIENKILVIRGQQVMLDRDLAELYGVETRVLNQAVKRNIERFPEDFMFMLDTFEKNELITNCDRFNKMKHSSVLPYGEFFTIRHEGDNLDRQLRGFKRITTPHQKATGR